MTWKQTWVAVSLAAALGGGAARADSSSTAKRTVTQLGEGLYVIRHPDAPDDFPQGNTTVVIGEREVLVVDSCYLPSSAREDVTQLRQWTKKPVRYLVNTHWHHDHVLGNATWLQAFPGLTVVAHRETQKQIAGYFVTALDRFPINTAKIKKRAETGKNDDGTPLSEQEKQELLASLPKRALVQAEFAHLKVPAPTLSFTHELSVDLGNREVQLKFLGRGNTAGDTVVVLPKEKIAIAGDLLDSPVPYLGGGYPADLVKTLEALGALDVETIVPGHGDVLRGKDYLRDVTALVKQITDQVSVEVYRVGNGPRNLEAVKEAVLKAVDLEPFRKKYLGDSKDDRAFFDGFSVNGVITAAYAQTWGR